MTADAHRTYVTSTFFPQLVDQLAELGVSKTRNCVPKLFTIAEGGVNKSATNAASEVCGIQLEQILNQIRRRKRPSHVQGGRRQCHSKNTAGFVARTLPCVCDSSHVVTTFSISI